MTPFSHYLKDTTFCFYYPA